MPTRDRGRDAQGREAESTARVCLLDYGMGNLRSVEKAAERVGAEIVRSSDPEVARAADGLILPGVGAFPRAMGRIRELGLDAAIAEQVEAGVPVLGICLGAQLLLSSSTELGGARGLGMIAGEVTELHAGDLKVPHIGWSPLTVTKPSRLTDGLASEEPFYFVHSFAIRPSDGEDVLGTAGYGETFAAAIERGNVFGVQFHPEKSSRAGLRLLRSFTAICAGATVPQ